MRIPLGASHNSRNDRYSPLDAPILAGGARGNAILPGRARGISPRIAAGVLVLVAAAAAILGWQLKPPEADPVTRVSHVLDDEQALTGLARPLVAIAPDGATIVYAARTHLY